MFSSRVQSFASVYGEQNSKAEPANTTNLRLKRTAPNTYAGSIAQKFFNGVLLLPFKGSNVNPMILVPIVK